MSGLYGVGAVLSSPFGESRAKKDVGRQGPRLGMELVWVDIRLKARWNGRLREILICTDDQMWRGANRYGDRALRARELVDVQSCLYICSYFRSTHDCHT